MESRFDPAKDAINQASHGLSLAFGDEVITDPAHIVVPTIRVEDEEERFKVVGVVGGKSYTAVFTWRDDVRRFMSVRRSNPGEERLYRAAG